MVQPLSEYLESLINITNTLAFDPTILLTGIYPTDIPAHAGNVLGGGEGGGVVCGSQRLEATQGSINRKLVK